MSNIHRCLLVMALGCWAAAPTLAQTGFTFSQDTGGVITEYCFPSANADRNNCVHRPAGPHPYQDWAAEAYKIVILDELTAGQAAQTEALENLSESVHQLRQTIEHTYNQRLIEMESEFLRAIDNLPRDLVEDEDSYQLLLQRLREDLGLQNEVQGE